MRVLSGQGGCGVRWSVMMSCRGPKLSAVCFVCEAGAGAGEPEARASYSRAFLSCKLRVTLCEGGMRCGRMSSRSFTHRSICCTRLSKRFTFDLCRHEFPEAISTGECAFTSYHIPLRVTDTSPGDGPGRFVPSPHGNRDQLSLTLILGYSIDRSEYATL